MSAFLLKGKAQDYIWSGTNLKNHWNKFSDLDKIAEIWELSLYPNMECQIISGEFKGKSLAELFKENKKLFGTQCNKFETFPILIKLIDAEDNLSIQVHPNDEYSLEKEKQLGKTEMWYVLQAEKDAGIYFGCKNSLTKEEFKASIVNNTVTENLNFVKVNVGDAFFIEAGTIHAILKGLTIFEVQENSNVTYRVYDYDRHDKNGKARELHIEKAIEVSSLKKVLPQATSFPQICKGNAFTRLLAECKYFIVEEVILRGDEILFESESFIHLMVIEGDGIIDDLNVSKGSSIFVPSNKKSKIQGNLKYIKTTIGGKQ